MGPNGEVMRGIRAGRRADVQRYAQGFANRQIALAGGKKPHKFVVAGKGAK